MKLRLLIVPYGIETYSGSTSPSLSSLLIVPYGIETEYSGREAGEEDAFNRTLWN